MEKILTKFLGIFFFAKKPLFIARQKGAIFGTFFVSCKTDQRALTNTVDESEKSNRLVVFNFANVFRFL